ncbi:NAD(P)-dependent oxidoreductase [Sphingobium nicotianae]|uniref:NAD(P)-dependent oxidoreductase n=1 Tax=Sphingobium nicotianae TaxID=2782607 RepID=A0A9X1DDA0_9SPHN|nr:NAD(P)-dependent oxidoreductase [Sphingobium nicotianae]MBT2187807.1 NAD(P)-dependent oxidoreductase [Sphingobium nicotianae]
MADGKDETRVTVLGFIGLGSMGSAMAPHLLAAGHKVVAFDPSAAAVDAFRAGGGDVAASAADLSAQADIVFLSLPTPAIVQEVARQVIPGKPRIVVDLSTTGPRASISVAQELGAAGIGFVDAPVSGGRAGALGAKLALMVACPLAIWNEVQPLLALFGKTFHVGEGAGQAQTMKLVNNMLSVVALAATSEGMAMGVKAGLDPAVMLDVLNASSGRNSATTDKMPRAVLPGSFDFGFATQLSLKDMKLCLDEAEAAGVPMIVGPAARAMLNITQASYGPDSDFTSMAKVVEQWAGVKIRSER